MSRPRIHLLEKGDPVHDQGSIRPFDTGLHRLPGARRRQNRVIPLLQELPGRCDRGVGHDLDAAGLDHGDLPVDDAVRESILRYAVAQHPPRPGKPLEHGNGVSQPGQVIGRRQAAGPGADDGHPLAGRLRLPFIDELAPAPLKGRPFQHPDRDRLVELDARALAFAGMNAGMAAHGGKGDLFADHGQRPVEVPVPDMPDVAWNVDARGTGFSARSDRRLSWPPDAPIGPPFRFISSCLSHSHPAAASGVPSRRDRIRSVHRHHAAASSPPACNALRFASRTFPENRLLITSARLSVLTIPFTFAM